MARLVRALLGSLFLLTSCRSFEFERQQVFLRYTPETDVLDVLLAYEGVGASKDEPATIEQTSRVLDAIGAGRRHVMLFDWPFEFDLDKMMARLDPEDELARRFARYQTGIQVLEARFLVDEREKLCLLQHVQLKDASAGLRLLDAAISREVSRELEGGAGDGSDFLDDPGTRERIRRRADEQGSWARFDGTSLVVSVPMTPQAAAIQLREIVREIASHGRKGVLEPDSLSAILLDGEELRLTFSPAPDGWIAFAFADAGRTYRPAIAEERARMGNVEKRELAAAIVRLKAGAHTAARPPGPR